MIYRDSSASFSGCGLYRWSLTRVLTSGTRGIAFVGLNPSTADATKDDPTIRRCVGFALDWGYDVLHMLNVHAFRSTDPKGLLTCEDPVGVHNFAAIQATVSTSETVIIAWGANPLQGYAHRIALWLMSHPKTYCLGQTKAGAPKHPLYLPASTAPRRLI